MSKFTKVAVFLTGFAVLFCVFSCESEEKQEQANTEKKIELAKEDSINRYNNILAAVNNDTSLLTEDRQAIDKVKLKTRADSARKKLEKILSGYDSVGVDSLGRTIFAKRRGPK